MEEDSDDDDGGAPQVKAEADSKGEGEGGSAAAPHLEGRALPPIPASTPSGDWAEIGRRSGGDGEDAAARRRQQREGEYASNLVSLDASMGGDGGTELEDELARAQARRAQAQLDEELRRQQVSK